MENIFLVGAVQALFFSILLLNKSTKAISDKILFYWLLAISFHLFIVFFINRGVENPHLIRLHISLPLIHFSFLYLYAYTLIAVKPAIKTICYLHFLPFLISFLLVCLLLSNETAEDFYKVRENPLLLPPLIIHLIYIASTVIGAVYFIAILRMIKNHVRNLKQIFSDIDKINLSWLKKISRGLAIVWISAFGYIILTRWLQFKLPFPIDTYLYGALTIFTFFIGFEGIKQTTIFLNPQFESQILNTPGFVTEESEHNKSINISKETSETINTNLQSYKSYGLKDEDAKIYLDKLMKKMVNEKPYLNPKLTLRNLAEQLDIYPHYLTQILNEKLHRNFYDFINAYRVEEVKKQLADPQNENLTLLAIAYESGFNSKSTFNRVFKQFTRLSPSQYLRSPENLTA